ncbi:MAG: zinc ABC transporter substrate-binding protein [Candidatus Diapherotrites archaeon]|nr:zinc ABC transporter substrate-binding protein [Candidatus Diapherotrites archaeon]
MNKFLFLIILIFLFGCIQSNELNSDKINVIVSVLPQKEALEFIGKDKVNATVLIPPGASPATYNPSPQDLIAVENADIYFKIGLLSFEKNNEEKFLELNPDLKIINLSDLTELREIDSIHLLEHELNEETPEHSESEVHSENDESSENELHEEHNHSGMDPHLWLSPLNMIKYSNQVNSNLSELKPEFTEFFNENKEQYVSELNSLHSDLTQLFSSTKQKKFLVFHPSWGYFADEFGLQQIAIEQEGKEPTASELKKLIDFALIENIKIVFVQEQFSEETAKTVAEQINGTVISINPLSENYLENMHLIGEKIASELN